MSGNSTEAVPGRRHSDRTRPGVGPSDVRCLTLTGEIDAARDDLARSLEQVVVQEGAYHVVVDLMNVTFIDSSVVRSLVLAHRTLEERGGWLRLVYTHHMIGRVIDLCGLATVLPQYTSLHAAMRVRPRAADVDGTAGR